MKTKSESLAEIDAPIAEIQIFRGLFFYWCTLQNLKCLSFAAQTSDGRSDGKSKKVNDEYAAKLNSMQTELKKLQAAKREHTKLLRNQTHYETQLRTLRNDLASLKQLKVCTMMFSFSLSGCYCQLLRGSHI